MISVKKLFIASTAVVAVFVLLSIFKPQLPNEQASISPHKHSEIDIGAPTVINNDFDIKVIDIEDFFKADIAFNNYQSCKKETDNLRDQANDIKVKLVNLSLGFDSQLQIDDALTLLNTEGVKSTGVTISSIAMSKVKKDLEGMVTTSSSSNKFKVQRKRYTDIVNGLSLGFRNIDIDAISEIYETKIKDSNEQWTIVRSDFQQNTTSLHRVFAQGLAAFEASTALTILANLELNQRTVAELFRLDIDDEILKAAVLSIPRTDEHGFFYIEGKVETLLSLAINSNSLHVYDLVKKHRKKLEIAPQVSYLNKLIERLHTQLLVDPENLTEFEKTVLQDLILQGEAVSLWPNARTMKYELLGSPSVNFDLTEVNKLRAQDIPVNIVKRLEYETSMSSLSSTQETTLRSEAVKYRNITENFNARNAQCKDIEVIYKAMEPGFKDIPSVFREIENYNRDAFRHVENRVKNNDSVLFNVYLSNIANSSSDPSIEETATQLFDDFADKQLSPRSKKKRIANLNVIEQTLLLNKICKVEGFDATYNVIGFLTEFYLPISNINSCLTSKSGYYDLLGLFYDNRGTEVYPSKVYHHLLQFELQLALNLIKTGAPSHGFKNGRDSLSLVLDRVVKFDHLITNEEADLLEMLIINTSINQFHKQRIARLRLKDNDLYKHLVSLNKEAEILESIQASNYWFLL